MLQIQNYNTHGANYYSYLYIFLLHICMLLILWKQETCKLVFREIQISELHSTFSLKSCFV